MQHCDVADCVRDVEEVLQDRPVGGLGDLALLPWVSGLHGLKQLHLTILNAPDGPCAELATAVSHLRSLTRLVLDGIRLPPNCQLACAPRLVELVVHATIQAADIRLFASLPSLRSLRLRRPDLVTDLSHLPRPWTSLHFRHPPAPQLVLLLPSGKDACVWSMLQWDGHVWRLNVSKGLSAARVTVGRAAAWLGALKGAETFEMLTLSWDEVPDFRCSELLAGLGPMNTDLRTLDLNPCWPLCAEDISEGARHLPALSLLRLELRLEVAQDVW